MKSHSAPSVLWYMLGCYNPGLLARGYSYVAPFGASIGNYINAFYTFC